MQRSTTPLSPLERSVVAALLVLLVAAGIPSLVQQRRAPREAELRAVRASFAEAVSALHGRWLLAGDDAREIELRGAHLVLNEHGWPTIDPRHPAQDTANEIYALLMEAPLPSHWRVHETPVHDAGVVTFTLPGAGGDSFRYDAATGAVE
jgi:hypothetical protein